MAQKLHFKRVPTRHRALHADNTTEPEDPPCDRPPPARCSSRNAFALLSRARRGDRRRCCVCRLARRGCLQAPICRNGSAARRKRWRLADRQGAHHGSALTPDRKVRRRRGIGRHTKTGRRQIGHATARAAVGTLAGATLLFLQARLNRKPITSPQRHSKVSDPRLTSKGGGRGAGEESASVPTSVPLPVFFAVRCEAPTAPPTARLPRTVV
mgnify:FL=1